jgi:predicted AAA+ superfamily ATPase
MKDQLKTTYYRLLDAVKYDTRRYLFGSFSIKSRLTGLIGPRGTGKTTLMLQFINEIVADKSKCLYLSLDNIYFSANSLYEYIIEQYETEAIKTFFLDEVHKYKNWNQELKNIYDSFPDINIVFSGSSSLDLIKGTYDLSRRGILYRLNGMSFREYLLFNCDLDLPVLSLEQIADPSNPECLKIASIEKIRGHFKSYMDYGYYPFSSEDKETYHQRLMNIIDKIIYEDIATYYNLKTANLVNFKKILAYLATIPPGEININSISKHIGVDNKTIGSYLLILTETGLTRLIPSSGKGGTLLKSTEKVFLENTNIHEAIVRDIGVEKSIGTARELFFIEMLQNSGNKVFCSKVGDYEVNKQYFEIGGKSKSRSQIKGHLDNSYLIKDDILIGEKGTIPLYLFGFLY